MLTGFLVYKVIIYQLGINPPADIASGRIAEVRSRSMSCNCMTRTSQQECRGILELFGKKNKWLIDRGCLELSISRQPLLTYLLNGKCPHFHGF